MPLRFPNESDSYRVARDELLEAERELRSRVEDVARLRRSLPPGGELADDYVFAGADGHDVAFAQLFGEHRTLLLYSFMYGPGDERPCPACTSLMDGWNGQHGQLTQRVAFAAVASGPAEAVAEVAAARGWSIPVLSAAGTDYQSHYHGEAPDGEQHTFMNVFVREDDGRILHTWGSELERETGIDGDGHTRHLDLTWPLWNLLDLAPEGRGDFFPQVFPESSGPA